MQEPMNSTTHRWSHSWYRSRYCPSSIVQDGGDTTINRTVPIYFQTSPDLCHHVGRGINPHGRAIILLALATIKYMRIFAWDGDSAYLHCKINHDIYINFPDGHGKPGKVSKLNKVQYEFPKVA